MKVLDNVLCRIDSGKSQTKKNRFNRFSEIENAFELKEGSTLENKHIVLVDDIVTTGATICSCIQQLESINNIKISFVCIAN